MDYVEYAVWILKALARRSAKSAQKMLPTHKLTGELRLSDLDIRSFTDSLRRYLKKQNPRSTLAKSETVAAETVRGAVKLAVKKGKGTTINDDAADTAIRQAKTEL